MKISLLPAALLLASCSSVKVREGAADSKADPRMGEIRVEAPRKTEEGQSRGFMFGLTGPDGALVGDVKSGDGPWAFEDLPPGRYELRIRGKKIRSFEVDLKVKAGRRTSLTFYAWRARAGGVAEDAAIVTGKTLLYTALGIVYLPFLAVQETLLEDDEDDGFNVDVRARDSDPKRFDSVKEVEKSPESPRPRVRSLLKNP